MRTGLALGAKLGLLTGLVVGVIDTIDVITGPYTGNRWLFVPYALSTAVLVGGLLGFALAGWVLGSTRAIASLQGKLGVALRAALVSLPWTAFVLWVPSGWIGEHWAGLDASGKAMAVACYPVLTLCTVTIAGLIDYWYGRSEARDQGRIAPRIAAAGIGALLAATFYVADRTLYVNLYDDFHAGLTVAFASAVAACVACLRVAYRLRRPASRSSFQRGVWLPFAALGLVSLVPFGFEAFSPDIFGPSRSVVFSKIRRVVHHATDWDGDGVSGLMGGPDCGPFDARVAPGNFDMPGNDLDEDCSGTSARWPDPGSVTGYPIPDHAQTPVLLITIDTLRADHLGSYGYRRDTSPAIDRLARESIRFSRAFSPAPKTYETFPALMTGRYPSNVPRDYTHPRIRQREKQDNWWYYVGDGAELLAVAMKRKGYRTAAFIGGSGMDLLGLDRGFDTYKKSSKATEHALRFFKGHVKQAAGAPFFVWIHYYAPHEPYLHHPEHDFGSRPVDRYDSEIASDDARVARVLGALRELGLAENTITVLTSDHGEEFGEHGGKYHSWNLYRELLHVPLIIKIPGLGSQVVTTPVEVIDIAPTLCELVKLHEKCDRYDGHSLLSAIAGKRDPKRGAYAEMVRKGGRFWKRSLYDGDWRLVQDIELGRTELYDVDKDPLEQSDVASKHPRVVAELLDRMATRPLYRQGRILSRYHRTGDRAGLLEALPDLRQEQLLNYALDELEKRPEPSDASQLMALSSAQDIPMEIRRRAKRMFWVSRGAQRLAGD